MSQEDEARYGRLCLLVLNICPFTLRHVIDNFHSSQGAPSLEAFLDSHKDKLFHLAFKRCCCRSITSNNTPMYRSQWDLLFTKTSLVLSHPSRGECPCQYKAVPGIVSDVMDITLCCLIIRNLCPGVNMADVDTIRDTRNQLIHSSNASMDEPTYIAKWNSVEGAVLSLARSVSLQVEADTRTMLQQLKDRIMNTTDLQILHDLITDQQQLDSMKEDVRQLQVTISRIEQRLGALTGSGSDMAADLGSLQRDAFSTRAEVTELQRSTSRTRAEVAALQRGKAHTRAEVTQLQRSASHTRAEVAALQRGTAHTRAEVTQLQRSASHTRAEVTQLQRSASHTRAEVTELQRSTSHTRAEVAALQRGTAHTRAEVTELQRGTAHTRDDVTALQRGTAQTRAEVTALQGDATNTAGRISQLEIDTSNTATIVESHSRQIQGLQRETQRLQQRHTEDFPEWKIHQLKEVVYQQNLKYTRRVPVAPLQKSAKDLPVELLYVPVSVREDLEVKDTKKKPNKKNTKDDSATSQPGDDHAPEQNPKSKPVNSPGDMFYKDGKPVRFVFMRGEAGRGKTVYCQRLLKYWCTAKEPGKDKNTLTDWEKGVDEYAFLFHVVMRHVNKCRSSLIDMLCLDMFQHNPECYEAIRHVLTSSRFNCLFVVDGLDEWKSSPQVLSELTRECFPNIEGISCSTYFIASRPWKVDEVDVSVRKNEDTRIVEIHGLDQQGVKLVIENVLNNFYDKKSDSPEFQKMFWKILKNTKNEKYKSLMEIPLLVTASVQLWYEESEVGDSMTSFYTDLVRLLIRRTYREKHAYQAVKEKMTKSNLSDLNIPQILQKNRTIKDFIVVLCTLGEVAFLDLVSQETNLVFQIDELEDEVGQTEIEFALNVGLLSQCEAPGKFGTEKVSVNFFHKTMQEFLTAVNIVCRDKVGIESLCSHLTSVKQIMDLSNVIMFTSGLSPSLGSILSQHIVSVTDKDVDVCKYRETFDYSLQDKVELLYGVQVSCYQEMKHNVSTSGSSLQDITYHVADVCVAYWSDTETERVTGELLCDPHVNIKSLYVWGVDITDSINTFLHNTTSLQHLCIRGDMFNNINLHSISDQLHSLKTLHLYCVALSPDAVCGLQKSLQNNTVLQSLTLEDITCRGESGEKIEITLSLNSMPTSLQHLCISGEYGSNINLHSISDQLHSLKTLRLSWVTLSPDAVCGLQKSLQNNTVLQSLILWNITCRGESGEDVPASLCDVLRVLPDSLTTLHINRLKYKEEIMMLVDVLPRLHHLHSVVYYGECEYHGRRTYRNAECDVAVAQTLSCMKQLQRLQLEDISLGDRSLELTSEMSQIEEVKLHLMYISLGDRSLELTSEMSQIEEVVLHLVKMSAGGWNKFVLSLINIPHHFVVRLMFTDIDDASRTMICSSPCFTVTWDDRSGLEFTRVAPSTQCTGKQ